MVLKDIIHGMGRQPGSFINSMEIRILPKAEMDYAYKEKVKNIFQSGNYNITKVSNHI